MLCEASFLANLISRRVGRPYHREREDNANSSANQEDLNIMLTPADVINSPDMTSRHNGVTATSNRTTTLDFPTMLPGAPASDGCTQSFPCSGDITN